MQGAIIIPSVLAKTLIEIIQLLALLYRSFPALTCIAFVG